VTPKSQPQPVWTRRLFLSPAGRVTTVGPRRMTVARGFGCYLSGIDAGTEVPPLGLIAGRRAGGAGSRSRRSSTPHAGTAAATRPVA